MHGAKSADPMRGLEEGTPVVVHYVAKGEEMTAVEVDRLGGDGLRMTEGRGQRVAHFFKCAAK